MNPPRRHPSGWLAHARLLLFLLPLSLVGGCFTDEHGSDASSDSTGSVDFDVVYVRYPRRGNFEVVQMPDGENPYNIEAGADLVLLRADGSEEILVDCRTHDEPVGDGEVGSSVQDPVISHDARWVYYSKYVDLEPGTHFEEQPGHCYLYKMALDVPSDERQEIQLTNLGRGFETPKLANNSSTRIRNFGIRDLGAAPLPGGRILFTSNREAIVAPRQGVGRTTVSAVEASTASQLFVVDDHDGSDPNRNLHRIGFSNLHQVQHPIILRDGRVLFSNWDDAGLKPSYGIMTLYTCHQDGTNLKQFLEPHGSRSRVDHFVTELATDQIVVSNYYPFMRLWGFGLLHRYPLDPPGPDFVPGFQREQDDWRYFSRRGIDNMTPHTDGEDQPAPDGSGRYSMPTVAPDDLLLVSYSPGPVASGPPAFSGPLFPVLDAGIYFITGSSTRTVTDPTDPAALVRLRDDPRFNEMWPRPVVPYARVHGVASPSREPPDNGLGPTPRDRGLVLGTPMGLLGTSSVQNRESTPRGADLFNSHHGQGHPSSGWVIQGTDAGAVESADVVGVRIVAVIPDRYHPPFRTSGAERDAGLLFDGRANRHVKGYYTHSAENWKILGEFPVRHPSGVPDPDGEEDTSFLARVPANTPVFVQGIDARAMTLFSEQTWRHVGPGQTVADCGGCHAHSREPVPFAGKFADSSDYEPVDVTSETPLLEFDPITGLAFVERRAERVLDIEFGRDVLPVLERECRSCHSSPGQHPPELVEGTSPRLSMFDSTLDHAFQSTVRTYRSIARDASGEFAHDTAIPAGKTAYLRPQASRYVRMLQARSSLLAWKIYGERLDGRTNGELPDARGLASEDIDFERGICPAPSLLSTDEKQRITRWIDLGCAIDLDRPRQRYTDDHMPPLLTVHVVERGGGAQLRVGFLDLESGIRETSLLVRITMAGVLNIELGMDDLSFEPGTAVGVADLPLAAADVSEVDPLFLVARVADRAGNSETTRMTVTSLPFGW